MEHGCYRIREEQRTIHLNLFQGVEYDSLKRVRSTFDVKDMNPKLKIGVAILLHGIATFFLLLAVGTVWAAIYVFGFGKWDPKFGPWGMFQLYFIIAAALAGIQAGVFLLCHSVWAVVNRSFLWRPAICSALLLALANVGLPFLAPLGESITFTALAALPFLCSWVMLTSHGRKQISNQSVDHYVSPGADAG